MITKQACQDESVVFSLFPIFKDDIIIFSRLVEEHTRRSLKEASSS